MKKSKKSSTKKEICGLKVGDRFVYLRYDGKLVIRGVVIDIDTTAFFSIEVKEDDGSFNNIKPGPHIMPEALYDSPLMKALK